MAMFVASNSRFTINGVEVGAGAVYPVTAADVIQPFISPNQTSGSTFTVTLVGSDLGSDLGPFDVFPDFCWRCDAVEADDDLGLCAECRDDLVG